MPTETIGDWERRRGYDLTLDQIADAPETAEPDVFLPPRHEHRHVETVALLGRVTAGLGVQLLLDRATGDTFLTCTLDGDCETFAVDPEDALDAFHHPFVYGCTLPL